MLASGVINSVLPSGGAAFTVMLAMIPAAPGLFSTTTGRPSDWRILSATRRVMVSMPAPGGRPTTMRNGRSSARAVPAIAMALAKAARRVNRSTAGPPGAGEKLRAAREIVTWREIDFGVGQPHFWIMADTTNFAPEYDAPIDYMRRTRDYYIALGYDNPYRWAHYVDAPFTPLKKPLKDSTLALITTAALYQPDRGDQGPGAAYNAGAKFYSVYSGDTAADHDTRISHIGYDRKHTTAKDSNTWFPLPMMREFEARGGFKLAERFHGAPTNRSQRVTLETDAPEILARCRQDQVDAALLVPT